jgi:pimeloyl-ACP methyl ester carboxylesterase
MTLTLSTLPGVNHEWVEANGLRFHVATAGTAGPPVLLLHGFPQHWYAWRDVITDLAVDHRVYALDLRGFGWSDAPRSGYDTDSRTADVMAVLDALGLAQVTLVGHEAGGWLGFHLALAAPGRFSALVAVNSPHPWLSHRVLLPQMWRFWCTALFEYPVLGGFVIRRCPAVLRWLLRRGRRDAPADSLTPFVDSIRSPARARAGQQLHWQMVLHAIPRRFSRRYRDQRLEVPTLLLAGRKDFALSPRSFSDTDGIRVSIVDGGHYLPEERPHVVAAAISGMAPLRSGHDDAATPAPPPR